MAEKRLSTIILSKISLSKISLGKISKYSLYLLAFLLPLFFLPYTASVVGFPKQTLLLFLVVVSLTCFVLKSLIEKEIKIKKTFLNYVVLAIILIFGASTIFSLDSIKSFFGPINQISSGFLTLLCLAILYFLVLNSFNSKSGIKRILEITIISGFIAALFSSFQIWGEFLLPWNFTQAVDFHTMGNVTAVAFFAAALLPIVIILMFTKKNLLIRILLGILGLVDFFVILLANFWAAWVALAVGMLALAVFLIIQVRGIGAIWLLLPIIILAFSFVFAFARTDLPLLPNRPLEVTPSYKASFDIGKKIASGEEGALRSALGTGPGTFSFLHSQFKSRVLNRTNFWAVRFPNAPSQMLGLLGTTGILGVLGFLALIAGLAFVAIPKLAKRSEKINETRLLGIGIFSGWLVLAIGKFLYSTTISLSFLFWLLTALFLVLAAKKSQNLY